jgi:hypothetical protein
MLNSTRKFVVVKLLVIGKAEIKYDPGPLVATQPTDTNGVSMAAEKVKPVTVAYFWPLVNVMATCTQFVPSAKQIAGIISNANMVMVRFISAVALL